MEYKWRKLDNTAKLFSMDGINNTSMFRLSAILKDDIDVSFENISKIKEKVIGQNQAIQTVCDKLLASTVGFKDEKQPVATFLLIVFIFYVLYNIFISFGGIIMKKTNGKTL